MPRVVNAPTSHKGWAAAGKQPLANTPHKSSPVKLSLNDDRTEKAARLQSRQALHDIQINQIHAAVAASPMRKMTASEKAHRLGGHSSPKTPRSAAANARHGDQGGGAPGYGGSQDRQAVVGSPSGLPYAGVGAGSAVTPMKRVPILANFEEWMKMATDNKINATNSWNFALIDYFHDMSLLKEGDTVNFQKASCTLDGCVKIYTSRVDSVATETGKLLSGLADSGGGGKKSRGGKDEGEAGESGDDEDGEEGGGRKKGRKKAHRSHEQTLAPSFASLQLKKLELEFTVDPLFKKASADFDEGGAKGLLLNHLSIDSEGRIVFDSSDDTADAKSYPNTTQMQQTVVDPTAASAGDLSQLSELLGDETQDQEVDLTSLAAKFFPDLSILDTQDICPSMKTFALGDPDSDLNLPMLRAPDDWRKARENNINTGRDIDTPLIDIPLGDRSGIFLDSENAAGFDDDDDDAGGPLGGFDVGSDVGFGEGGEAWAKEAALEPMLHVAPAYDGNDHGQDGTDGMAVGDFDPANPDADAYAVGLHHRHQSRNNNNEEAGRDPTDNILSYFDATLKSSKATSWAGPEHWRVRKIKAAASGQLNPAPARTRKEKEPFEIDFSGPMTQSLAEMLYTPAASNAAISLPKSQWKTKGRNLLPDDRHFSSRSLLQLWLKPKARVGRRRRTAMQGGLSGREGIDGQDENRHTEMDEAYWARRREEEDRTQREQDEVERDQGKGGDYDANFFADDDDDVAAGALPFGPGLPDDMDDDDDGGMAGFTDAREMLSPNPPPTAADTRQPQSDAPLLAPPTPPPAPQSSSQPGHDNIGTGFLPTSFGAQLVTGGAGTGGPSRLLRPEYVNYARVAKKVDVRRLKENMWRGMAASLISSTDMASSSNDAAATIQQASSSQLEVDPSPTTTTTTPEQSDQAASKAEAERDDGANTNADVDGNGNGYGNGDVDGTTDLKFSSLIHNLTAVYPERQMRDISTSYCFICLLHLANEKGLVLESGGGGEGGGGERGKGGDGEKREEDGYGYGVKREGKREREGEGGGGYDEYEYETAIHDEIRVRRDPNVGVGYVGE